MSRPYLLTLFLFAFSIKSMSQDGTHGWQLKDKESDGFYGISLGKAYQFLHQKHKKPKDIIVAVIDSGIDTLHEDLKAVLWNNRREIPGNGIDDDHNGYIDDLHGWNFLGGTDGQNCIEDSHEENRVYHRYKNRFSNISDSTKLDPADKQLFLDWKRAAAMLNKDIRPASSLARFRSTADDLRRADSLLQQETGKKEFTVNELDTMHLASSAGQDAKKYLLGLLNANHAQNGSVQDFVKGFHAYVLSQEEKAAAINIPPAGFRKNVTADDEEDITDTHYGNADVMTKDGFHGTHVSGIIAADRTNQLGMDGVADHTKIMMLRVVPNGDEHDKDIALAIRYAVDNGARIINMSFGKGFSPHKDWIDEAVRYAAKHDVLLVQAAGNSNENIDTAMNFPTPIFLDGTKAANWIMVGASGDSSLGGIRAGFSNYGKQLVDVFAPGVFIYSTVPGGNKYLDEQGTSMASPVVAGIAAILRAYYPNLNAIRTKWIIEHSVVKPVGFDLGAYCSTGGIVNAFNAVRLADRIHGK